MHCLHKERENSRQGDFQHLSMAQGKNIGRVETEEELTASGVWVLIGPLRFQLLWSCSSPCSCEGEPVIAAMLAVSLAPVAVEIERVSSKCRCWSGVFRLQSGSLLHMLHLTSIKGCCPLLHLCYRLLGCTLQALPSPTA
jgi:hypothetical protein